MTAVAAPALDRLLWIDLLRVRYRPGGRDHRDGLDCYGLLLEVMRRRGVPLPPDPAYAPSAPGPAIQQAVLRDGWVAIEDPMPGDAVAGRVLHPALPDHVGVYLGEGRILHVGMGCRAATVDTVATWKRRGWLAGFYRYDPAAALEATPALAPAMVTVLFDPDPIGGAGRRTVAEPWVEGLRLQDLVPVASERIRVALNGAWTVDLATPVAAGDYVYIRVDPGIPVPAFLIAAFGAGSGPFLAFAGNVIIGSLIGLVASVIAAPSEQKLGSQEEGSPTFNLDAVQNTVANGTPIAVVYGEHRFGGQILQAFFEVDEQFRSTLYVLVGIGEGEIESIGGLAGDWNGLGPSSIVGNAIEIDGNPAASYPTMKFSTRMGRTRQAPLPAFDRNVVAFGQDRPLRAPSPLVPGQTAVANNAETFLYTTSQAVDGFALFIRYSIGLYKIDATSGQEEDYSVFYTLRYRRKNNPGSEVVEVVIHGPSQKKADHTRMIKRVGLARDVYEIRITRMSDNDENLQRRYSASTLVAVNEYVSSDPICRNTKAMLGIEALATAQISGNVPRVSSIVKGKKVHVWDGVSTTSPAFTFAWSSNPAWVILDILLNKTYGLGRFVTLNQIDLQAFKDHADYCDALITTDGVQHKRWEFNYAFDTITKAWDAIGIVAAASRCTVVVVGGRYTIKIDKAASPTMLFSMGNIVRGSFVTRYPKTVDRPNMIRVGYRNENLDYDSDVAQLEAGLTAGEQYVRQDVSLYGIVDPRQAYRAAKYLLNVSQSSGRVSQWESPVDAIAVEPGDVVQVQHDVLLPESTGGRLYAVPSKAVINLDRAIVVPASPAWKLVVQSYDSITGTRIQQTVTPAAGTYAAGDDIGVSPSFSVTPEAGDVYAIGPSTVYFTSERILSIQRNTDQCAKIEAIAYDVGIYSDDPGSIETFTDLWPNARYHPTNPTGLRLVEAIHVLPDGTVASSIDVSFVPEKEGHEHDIWTRRMRDDNAGTETNEASHYEAMDWRYAGSTTIGQFKITEGFELKRPYQISITPRSPTGNRRDPASGAFEVFVALGKVEPPEAPTGLLCTELQDNRVRLTWTASTSREVAFYEVRAITASSGEPRKFLFSQVLAPAVVGTMCEIVVPRITGLYFQVSSVSRTGVRSILPAYVSYTPKLNDRSVLVSSAEPVTWNGTKTKMTVSGVALISDLGETTGSYQTTNTQHALVTSGGLLAILLDASGWQLDWTVDQCGYLVSSYHAQRMRVDGMLLEIPEPDQRLAASDNAYPVDSPGAYLFTADGQIDWDSLFKIKIEYDLAADSGATAWDGWAEYKGPVYIPANRYYVRVKVTITNVANANLRIQLDGLYVTQTAQVAKSVVATDPNSHYSGADDVDARLVELGYALRELQSRWASGTNNPSDYIVGTYDSTLKYKVVPAPASTYTTLMSKAFEIPNWYQATGGVYFTVEVTYRVLTIPGTDKQWVLRVGHSTYDVGEAVPALTWNQTNVLVPSTANNTYVYRATFNITVGALGSGDEFACIQVARYGTDAVNDTLTGSTIHAIDVKVTAGVKVT